MTGKNDYANNIKAVVALANNETSLPNKKCVEANPENPHYCLMAEHLVKYIETPLFIDETLYDIWQLQNILHIPCMKSPTWPPDLNNCTGKEDQLTEVHKFANYTRDLLM